MRLSQETRDWLTVIGLFAVGILIVVILTAVALFMFELLGIDLMA